MLVRQPVVFGILKLKVGVSELALLGSEVLEVLGAVVSVAQLILVVHSWAVLATIGGSGEGNGWTSERQIRQSFKTKNKTTNPARKVLQCYNVWGYF